MANLRTNNLSGEQGQNAYRGSVFFDGGSQLDVTSNSDFAVGTGAYTAELWFLSSRHTEENSIFGTFTASNFGFGMWHNANNLYFEERQNAFSGDNPRIIYDTFEEGHWYHLAMCRDSSSGTLRAYVNGVQIGSTTSNLRTIAGTAPTIGENGAAANQCKGYISNIRFSNTELYPSGTTFTPPTSELTADASTILLACQDSDNPLKEETGKTITGFGNLQESDNTELVTNSGFTADISGWTASGVQWSHSSGALMHFGNGNTQRNIYQDVTTVIGKRYVFRVEASSAEADTAYWQIIGSSDLAGNNFIADNNNAAPIEHVFYFTADSTTTKIRFYSYDSSNSSNVRSYWYKASLQLAPQPEAPKVIPPYGVDAGNTFGGPIQQSSQGYIYFRTGRTEERGRGRAVFLGGGNPQVTAISFTQIQSAGNAQNFGSLITSRTGLRGGSSSTRGLSAHSSSTVDNTIEFITIVTEGNTIDFGDMSGSSTSGATGTNDTRAVFWIGTNPSTNVIDFATIASLGNSADFGDMSVGVRHIDTMNSSTRCVIPAGWTSGGVNTNTIQFITFATTGNAQDFGDVDYSGGMRASGGFSSPTRGVFAGGADSPSSNAVNIIHFVTLASTGNSTDFGDISAAKRIEGGGTSSHTRGLIAGSNSPAQINTIEFVTIATTGDAQDFGDLMSSRSQDGYVGALSDCHGGLS